MTAHSIQESLGIFWDGEEVDGITVYGLWKNAAPNCPAISRWLRNDGVYERHSELKADDWHIWVWDIKIEKWPVVEEWSTGIRNMLHSVINAGAKVAWCGLEGIFVDPPDLFKPEYMAGGVWAAMTEDKKFYFHAELCDEFKKLSDKELLELYSYMASQLRD